MAKKPAKSGAEGALTGVPQILAELLGEPAQPSLPLPGDADAYDVIGQAAETLNAKRRARGRPEGSANRRNAEMFDYLEARGFKAPEVRLMEIVSADPVELARAMNGGHPLDGEGHFPAVLEVIKLQLKAAADLMPYKFAKRQELKVEHDRRETHVFVAGRLTDAMSLAAGKGFALDGGLSNDFNGAAVRQPDNASHETPNSERSQNDSTGKAADQETVAAPSHGRG